MSNKFVSIKRRIGKSLTLKDQTFIYMALSEKKFDPRKGVSKPNSSRGLDQPTFNERHATNQFNHLMKQIAKKSLETQTAIGEWNSLRFTTSGVSSRDNAVNTVDRLPQGSQSLNVAKERFSNAIVSRQTDISPFGSATGYSSLGANFTDSEAEQGDVNSSSYSFTFYLKSASSTREIRKKIMSSAQKCSLRCDKLSKYEFKIIKLYPALAQELPESTRIVFCVEIIKSKGQKNLKGLKFNLLNGDTRLYNSLATYFLSVINL
jgi:hypothetical protein